MSAAGGVSALEGYLLPEGSAPGGEGCVWSGGCLLLGGVWSGGVSAPGGVWYPNITEADSPAPVDRITDACKNITLATTSLRPVKMQHYLIREILNRYHAGLLS